jgi:hypothetical protein
MRSTGIGWQPLACTRTCATRNIVIIFGFLLQWPTILTVIMFPLLVWMCVRRAQAEEREADWDFGVAYERYSLGGSRAGALMTTHRSPPP